MRQLYNKDSNIMKISFAELPARASLPVAETLIFTVAENKRFSAFLQSLDKDGQGFIRKAVDGSRFTGKKGQYLVLPAPAPLPCTRVLLAGIGNPASLDLLGFEHVG